MRRTRRLLPAIVIALFASMLMAGGALAGVQVPDEQTTGKVGPYVIPDEELDTLVTCHYGLQAVDAKMTGLTIDAPEVRWPDTKPAVPGQKGKVGWRVLVQQLSGDANSWTTVAQRPMQKRTATETTAAPFTPFQIERAATSPYTALRVVVLVAWFNPDGSLRGRVKHWMRTYAVGNGAALTWDAPVCVEMRDFPAP